MQFESLEAKIEQYLELSMYTGNIYGISQTGIFLNYEGEWILTEQFDSSYVRSYETDGMAQSLIRMNYICLSILAKNYQQQLLSYLMERQLNYKHLKQGFSLLEVVISLLIVSITFLAYSQLIDQNLKAQDLKQTFVEESNLKANLLTLYVIDPDVDDYIVQDMLNVDDIEQTQLSRYQNVREIEIKIEHPGSETTLIIYK